MPIYRDDSEIQRLRQEVSELQKHAEYAKMQATAQQVYEMERMKKQYEAMQNTKAAPMPDPYAPNPDNWKLDPSMMEIIKRKGYEHFNKAAQKPADVDPLEDAIQKAVNLMKQGIA
jgi:hypothetical protein